MSDSTCIKLDRDTLFKVRAILIQMNKYADVELKTKFDNLQICGDKDLINDIKRKLET